MKRVLFTLSLSAVLILVAAPVQAGTIWIGLLTSDHCTGGCGTPPFGKVVLIQDGPDVDFTVTLYGDHAFVLTGAGDGMNFKFNGLDVAVGDISSSDMTAAFGNFNGDGGGMFHFGVYFTGQGPGASDPRPGPIEFTVADATIAQLTQPNELDQIFVADIISGETGKTGLVDVSSGYTVPEPNSMLLLGLGLVVAAGVVRRFKK